MPILATIRNLTRFASLGLLNDTADSSCVQLIIDRLTSAEQLLAARVHPLTILIALREYENGAVIAQKRKLRRQQLKKLKLKGRDQSSKLLNKFISQTAAAVAESATELETEERKLPPPNPKIVVALNVAFVKSFDMIIPTGKKIILAIDTGESMQTGGVLGCRHLTPLEASVALATLLMRREPNCQIVAVCADAVMPLTLAKNAALKDVSSSVDTVISASKQGDGGCKPRASIVGQLMTWAIESGQRTDAFILLTNQRCGAVRKRVEICSGDEADKIVIMSNSNNEGIDKDKAEDWSELDCRGDGSSEAKETPKTALYRYHSKTNSVSARLVYVSLTSLRAVFDMKDDARLINLAGFDVTTPSIIASFLLGQLDPVMIASIA